MKNLILAAFAAVSLAASIATANATIGLPHNAFQSGSYDSSNNAPHHAGSAGGGS